MRVATAVLSLSLATASGLSSGCATCDPEKPKVEPSVGGSIGTGSGGTWTSTGVGFNVTNLFCRAPEPPTEPELEPGAGSEPQDHVPER